jgi:hypothetical protein
MSVIRRGGERGATISEIAVAVGIQYRACRGVIHRLQRRGVVSRDGGFPERWHALASKT